MISLRDVSFAYNGRKALDHISLDIERGEHVAIVGPNASGKTTLAMLMNGLLVPDTGACLVDGIDTRDDPTFARRTAGLVFQDPESQAVSRRVWDDVAFGPRNLGLPEDEVAGRVRESLSRVGFGDKATAGVSGLSGGQKQLLAIAGILAMRPAYVILDEPAALLDGPGRRLVLEAIAGLKKNGAGSIVITHDMEEALFAGRVLVLQAGRVVADGPPSAVFSDAALMGQIGIRPPYIFELENYAGLLEVIRECR